jgi:general secretion pathway protein N
MKSPATIPIPTTGRVIASTLLLSLSLGLAAAVYDEVNTPSDETSSEESASAAISESRREPAPDDARFSLPPLRDLKEVTDRPLFSPSRRPPPPQASQEAIKQSGSLALDGVILSSEGRIALISHGRPPVLVHVAEGREIEGWTVLSIQADHIVLQRDATRQEIKLADKAQRQSGGAVPKP